MKLDFKGIITKEALEKDISNLDSIMDNNDYAIVVEDGVGKFVIFSMDFVKYRLELIDEEKSRNRLNISPYTLVESMIQVLEELPEKKTTAIMLSSLVEKYYGKKVSPVIIRTRAEENANNQGEVNYFIIEPGNVIGLSQDSSFDLYMHHKIKRGITNRLAKLLENDTKISLNTFILESRTILSNPTYYHYGDRYNHNQLIELISNTGKYSIINDEYIEIK